MDGNTNTPLLGEPARGQLMPAVQKVRVAVGDVNSDALELLGSDPDNVYRPGTGAWY